MSRSCSACGKDGTGTTTKAGGPTGAVCQGKTEYIRRHNMYVRVPREVCSRETGKAPIKTGWAETDKGQPGKPNVRARWVAKEYKTHARPELHASTPPLEALEIVLSEIATGEREGTGRRAEGVLLRSSTKKGICRIAARGLPAG